MYITKKILKKQIRKAKERAKIAYKILDGIDKDEVVCTCCKHYERGKEGADGKNYTFCDFEYGGGGGCFLRSQQEHFYFEPIEGILNVKHINEDIMGK